MRFTAMYIAEVPSLEGADTDEMYEAMNQNEDSGAGIVDAWIEEHFNKTVRCVICATRARVHPDDESNMVVTISSAGSAIIACEECLGALCFTAVLSMDNDQANEMVGRLLVELIDRTADRSRQKVSEALGGLIALQKGGQHIRATSEHTAQDEDSPLSKLERLAKGLNYQA